MCCAWTSPGARRLPSTVIVDDAAVADHLHVGLGAVVARRVVAVGHFLTLHVHGGHAMTHVHVTHVVARAVPVRGRGRSARDLSAHASAGRGQREHRDRCTEHFAGAQVPQHLILRDPPLVRVDPHSTRTCPFCSALSRRRVRTGGLRAGGRRRMVPPATVRAPATERGAPADGSVRAPGQSPTTIAATRCGFLDLREPARQAHQPGAGFLPPEPLPVVDEALPAAPDHHRSDATGRPSGAMSSASRPNTKASCRCFALVLRPARRVVTSSSPVRNVGSRYVLLVWNQRTDGAEVSAVTNASPTGVCRATWYRASPTRPGDRSRGRADARRGEEHDPSRRDAACGRTERVRPGERARHDGGVRAGVVDHVVDDALDHRPRVLEVRPVAVACAEQIRHAHPAGLGQDRRQRAPFVGVRTGVEAVQQQHARPVVRPHLGPGDVEGPDRRDSVPGRTRRRVRHRSVLPRDLPDDPIGSADRIGSAVRSATDQATARKYSVQRSRSTKP